ncbi:hypothetical protein GGI12_000071 [Dipsacomyces acuminosporus]|nr:hypothetical protein GGI12_000071 [Dipsacomyces acuminosporus]
MKCTKYIAIAAQLAALFSPIASAGGVPLGAPGSLELADSSASSSAHAASGVTPAKVLALEPYNPRQPPASAERQAASLIQQLMPILLSGLNMGQAQMGSMLSVLNSVLSMVEGMLASSGIANQAMAPFTNFPQFESQAQSAMTQVQSAMVQLQSFASAEMVYLQSQAQQFSTAGYGGLNEAAGELSRALLSVYSFLESLLEVVLSSPLLTTVVGLFSVNPAVLAVVAIVASDPLKYMNNYQEWQSEISSRSAKLISNINQMSPFVSVGLPRLETAILGVAGSLANLGNRYARDQETNSLLQQYYSLLHVYPGRFDEVNSASPIVSEDAQPTSPVFDAVSPGVRAPKKDVQIVANAAHPASVIVVGPRPDKDAKKDERRKEWEQWAHQTGANGVPNGTNFVAQILNGVSGIVDSVMGPLYQLLSGS